MAPTIRDVARAAGVSIATVSHALSGKRPVSGATRRRIHAAAERLGYRPNQVAAAMITGRTMTLGVVVPDIANPFFGGLVSAAERAAAARGFTVVVCSSELDPELEAQYVRALADRRVDALVYLGGTPRRNAAVEELDVPLVAVDEALPWLPKDVSLVTSAHEHGGRLAAEHLLELGHGDVGVVTGQRGLPTAKTRLDGFRHAADVPRARVRWADYTLEGGRAAARDLLQAEPALTGLFCANDLMALGALEVARELGRAVPDDLAVVGFDDIFVSALVTPPLTTIRQPLARLGEEAAQLAIDLIEGQTAGPERRTLPVELVIRGSTAQGAARAEVLAAVDH
jgi:DNA-binding LacI/PurR family transcriptional regulator